MIAGTAHLDDLLVALLNNVRRKANRFTANRQELHRAFLQVKREYPKLMSTFRFRDKASFPESLGLDQALANLEASRLLHRQNAAPRFYEIASDLETAYSKYVSKRLREAGIDEAEIENAARRFLDLTHCL